MAPQVLTTPGPGPQKRGNTVDTTRVPQPNLCHHDHQDERPHACNDGWITLGQGRPRDGQGVGGVGALPLPQVRGAKPGRREDGLASYGGLALEYGL
jgi:hypothetical protein